MLFAGQKFAADTAALPEMLNALPTNVDKDKSVAFGLQMACMADGKCWCCGSWATGVTMR